MIEQGPFSVLGIGGIMKKKAIKYTNIVLTLFLIPFGIIDVVNDTNIFDYVYLGYVLTVTVITLVALIVEKRKRKNIVLFILAAAVVDICAALSVLLPQLFGGDNRLGSKLNLLSYIVILVVTIAFSQDQEVAGSSK